MQISAIKTNTTPKQQSFPYRNNIQKTTTFGNIRVKKNILFRDQLPETLIPIYDKYAQEMDDFLNRGVIKKFVEWLNGSKPEEPKEPFKLAKKIYMYARETRLEKENREREKSAQILFDTDFFSYP